MTPVGLGGTLTRYLLQQIGIRSLGVALGLLALALSARGAGFMTALPAWGPLPGGILLRLLAYVLASFAGLLLPLALFAGTLTALAHFRETGGWDAVRLAGGGPRRLLPLMLLLGGAMGTLAGSLNAWGEPWGRYGLRRLAVEGSVLQWAPGPWEVRWGTWTLAGTVQEGGNVAPLLLASPHPRTVITAASGTTGISPDGGIRLDLHRGQWWQEEDSGRRAEMQFFHLALALPISRAARPSREVYEMPPQELARRLERDQQRGRSDPSPLLLWHKRIAHPFASVALLLLVPPLALSGRRAGMRRSVALAGAVGLLFYGVTRAGDGWVVARGGGGEMEAAWAPVVVLAILGGWGWWRLGRSGGERR